MTTLWLWLNSTELNWTLNVRLVDGNCFALHYLLSMCACVCVRCSRALPLSAFSFARSLHLSLAICYARAPSLSLSRCAEISIQNFKFQWWVSQWLHTLTHAARIPINPLYLCEFQFCFRCPFQFGRECAPFSCSLSHAQVRERAKQNNHFTLSLDSIWILIVLVGFAREQQSK